MCLIVDASRLGVCLAEPVKADSEPILNWIRRGGRIVYSTGGKYGEELDKSPNLKRKLLELSRSGGATLVQPGILRDDERDLARRSDLRSDDPHILALARHSGARVLYTGDAGLMADFRNKSLVDRPRGKIYSGVANKALLRRGICGTA